MHGLVLRTLQLFLQDTYGSESWIRIASGAGVEPPEFEAMLHYDIDTFEVLLEEAALELQKPKEILLEDVGNYLISHPTCERIRRLLRYGGVDFIEFLHSLDDLPDRARLAVHDLDLPDLELSDHGQGKFDLRVFGPVAGYGHVLVGVMRAMADDYGALALLEHTGRVGNFETITLTVVETEFTEGRDFDLAGTAVEKKVG